MQKESKGPYEKKLLLKLFLYLTHLFYKIMTALRKIPGMRAIVDKIEPIFGTLVDKKISELHYHGSKKHFHAGFGDIENTQHLQMAVKTAMMDSSPESPLAKIETIVWEDNWHPASHTNNVQQRHGYFMTPLLSLSPETNPIAEKLLHPASHKAHFKCIAPISAIDYSDHNDVLTFGGLQPNTKTTVIMPAFGDQGFGHRSRMWANGLAEQGIASVMLEQYSYGKRRLTKSHERVVVVDTVSNLVLKGTCTLAEGTALSRHLQALGFEHLCVSGMSMGGGVALHIAGSLPFKVAAVGIVPCHRGSEVFTDKVLANACDYQALTEHCGSTEQAKERVNELLGEHDCRRYPAPRCPEALVILAARDDAYIPVESIDEIVEHWGLGNSSNHVRWIFGGHTSTMLLHDNEIQCATVDAFSILTARKMSPTVEISEYSEEYFRHRQAVIHRYRQIENTPINSWAPSQAVEIVELSAVNSALDVKERASP